MDEQERLRRLVQWYSAQLQGITLQLAQTQVENQMLKEQMQKRAEKEGGGDDAEVHSGAETG
jgi:hypothetical protein